MRTCTISNKPLYKEYHKIGFAWLIFMTNSLYLFFNIGSYICLLMCICACAIVCMHILKCAIYGEEVRSQLVSVALSFLGAQGLNTRFWVLRKTCLPAEPSELFHGVCLGVFSCSF